MNEELKNTLIGMKKEYYDIDKRIEKLTELRDTIQKDIAVAIIRNIIKEKNFEGIVLVIDDNNVFDENHFIKAYIEDPMHFFKEKEIANMFINFVPGYDYHFNIEINEYANIVFSDGDYMIVFKNNIDAIKDFAKEFGFKIKYGKHNSVEEYDKIINEMIEKKNNFIKMKKLLEN